MTRILSGSFRNFLSIGKVDQVIDFTVNGLTLVLGENLDVGGINSRNGAGKTTIIQAISFGLYGKPLTKIRLDNLVNSINNKDMLVTIDFESRGKRYRIERGRKPAVLRFFCDGVQQRDDEAQGENRHTQAEIERILGLSHKMFRHIVVLNTSTIPFLREEVSVQREIIEELFGIMQLSQRANALKALMDVTKEQVRDAEAIIKANIEANNRITQAIDRAKAEVETWQTMQNHRVNELTYQAKTLRKIDIERELALFDEIDQWRKKQSEIVAERQTTEREIIGLTQEIGRLNQDVARYTAEARADDNSEIMRLERQVRLYREDHDIDPQIDRLLAEVARRQREAADKDAETDRLASDHASVMGQLAHPNEHTCATCGQGLMGTDHLSRVIANLAERRAQLADRIAELANDRDRALVEANMANGEMMRCSEAHRQQQVETQTKLAALQTEIAEARVSLAKRKASATQTLQNLQTTLANLTEQRQVCQDRLQTPSVLKTMPTSSFPNRDAVWQLRQDRDVLANQLETELARANPHAAKIEGLRGTLVEIDYVALNELNVRYKHEIFLHKLLTAKDSFIRKRIIDQNLNFLNRRLNHYSDHLRLPHEVAFQPDLTVEISLLGREFDFEQLSRGEMNRVVLANSWAFRDVWESLNDSLNLMFVDECLDTGMDDSGAEAALDILVDMGSERRKNVFLISHKDALVERVDQTMTVRKENQFSTFHGSQIR